jgi:hypothetical protein
MEPTKIVNLAHSKQSNLLLAFAQRTVRRATIKILAIVARNVMSLVTHAQMIQPVFNALRGIIYKAPTVCKHVIKAISQSIHYNMKSPILTLTLKCSLFTTRSVRNALQDAKFASLSKILLNNLLSDSTGCSVCSTGYSKSKVIVSG